MAPFSTNFGPARVACRRPRHLNLTVIQSKASDFSAANKTQPEDIRSSEPLSRGEDGSPTGFSIA